MHSRWRKLETCVLQLLPTGILRVKTVKCLPVQSGEAETSLLFDLILIQQSCMERQNSLSKLFWFARIETTKPSGGSSSRLSAPVFLRGEAL